MIIPLFHMERCWFEGCGGVCIWRSFECGRKLSWTDGREALCDVREESKQDDTNSNRDCDKSFRHGAQTMW